MYMENKHLINKINYLKLIEAHKAFYEKGYHKAYNYDNYLDEKDWGT